MIITSDVRQKSNAYVTTHTELENNTAVRIKDTFCNNVDCIFKPISRVYYLLRVLLLCACKPTYSLDG